jgi:hypothetical protein
MLTGMTSISLHVQWPLTSQSHDGLLEENNCFFVTHQTPRQLLFYFRAMAFLKLVSDVDGTAVRDATHDLLVIFPPEFEIISIVDYRKQFRPKFTDKSLKGLIT